MFESFLSLGVFVFAASVTPGPNNIMVMASGAVFGVVASLPHIFGIVFGFAVMVVSAGFGIGEVFDRYPRLETVFMAAAVLFLLHIAWQIARAAPPGEACEGNVRPLTFAQAAAFQWLNPKAWAVSVAVVTLYAAGETRAADIAMIVAMFALLGGPCVFVWCVFGHVLSQKFSGSPRGWRAFSFILALLVVASVVPLLL